MSDILSDPLPAYTLITGASDGLGVEFARLAAREGRNMILTARSVDKLNKVAQELAEDDLDILVIPADLSNPADVTRLWDVATDGKRVDVLVNNAGLGAHGDFADPDQWRREKASVDVNIMALTYLMKQAIPHMEEHGGGRILNVASVAAMMPGPHMAVYHATKAYVLSLSEAVAQELQGTNVSVTALCPGATKTNFFNAADMHGARVLKMGAPMKAFPVAEEGWLEARIAKRIVVPGIMNKLFVLMAKFFPRAITVRIANVIMAKG